MLHDLIEDITKKQLDCGNISSEEKEIYKYGYTLALNAIINIVVCLIIGILLKEMLFIIIFHLFFIPLRTYCGGFHASTMTRCSVISGLMILIATIIYKIGFWGLGLDLLFVWDLICVLVLVLSKPSDTKGKRLNENEKIQYQRIVHIQLLVHLIIVLCALCFQCSEGIHIFLLVHSIEVILLIGGKIKNHLEVQQKS